MANFTDEQAARADAFNAGFEQPTTEMGPMQVAKDGTVYRWEHQVQKSKFEQTPENPYPGNYFPWGESDADTDLGYSRLTTAEEKKPHLPVEDTRTQAEKEREAFLLVQGPIKAMEQTTEEVKGKNQGMVTAQLMAGWEDPGFNAYLESDDYSHENVHLPEALVKLFKKNFGVDEDTAKSYVHYHRLDDNDIALIEKVFLGEASPNPKQRTMGIDPRSYHFDSPTKQGLEDEEGGEDDDSYGEDFALGQDEFYSTIQDIVVELSIANPEYTKALAKSVVSYFEKLTPRNQQKYATPEGIKSIAHSIHTAWERQRGNSPQLTPQRAQQQQQRRGSSAQLTPQGKLKGSYIRNLSNVDYQKNSARIDAWINSGRVDWRQ